ncbi:hypothetical protein MCOR08_007186 [Pyricularia oryzae]|nr:hypothetical protein MCOR08_007186 [Pyricularia oryzae]
MHVALICHCHLADEVGVCGISVYTKTTWHNNVAVQNADGTRKRNYKRPAHYADGWYGTIWCAKMTRVKVPRLAQHVRVETQRSSRLAAVHSQAQRTHTHTTSMSLWWPRSSQLDEAPAANFSFCSDTGEKSPQPTPGSEPTTVPAQRPAEL